jgi:hypothetical protein
MTVVATVNIIRKIDDVKKGASETPNVASLRALIA